MDFTAFSDENFEVKSWVNSVLAESTEPLANSNENYASQLAMKLQLFIQEVNKSLEETSQEVLHNLPRVVRDAEAIRQEVMVLQSEMRAVKDDVAKVEHDTAKSMQMLLKIDGLKSRMQGACKALQDADNWTTLSADVEEVFQSRDFVAIAAKLQGMQQSLKILVDIPDYKERCRHLENLKNRLETLLGPHLIAAINTNSIDSAQVYVRIFADIERLGEVQKYYHKCTKAQLLQKWCETIKSDEDYTFINWISLYFDMLLSHWHTQMKWCSQVFPSLSALETLCNVLSDTLCSLDPPLSTLLSGEFERQVDEPLSFLIDVKQVFERFFRSLMTAIKLHNPGSLSADYVKALALAIDAPVKVYVLKYASYEEQRLVSGLDTISLACEDRSESIRLLSDSVVKVFALTDEGNGNCQQLTNGCGYPSLAKALNAFLNVYVDEVRAAIVNWKERVRVSEDAADSTNDWSFLQSVLQAVQICGDILVRTDALDQMLVSSFLNSATKFGFVKSGDDGTRKEIVNLDVICLEPDERRSLEKIVKRLTEDASASFMQEIWQKEVNLCEAVGRIAFDMFFSRIERQLISLPSMKTWSLENPSGVLTDLPTFGLAPQEYITQIGQCLMTVVQHIEPFTLQDNPALRAALRHGKLPYSKHLDRTYDDHIADYLLGCIAMGTCETYVETIFKVAQVTRLSVQRSRRSGIALVRKPDFRFCIAEGISRGLR